MRAVLIGVAVVGSLGAGGWLHSAAARLSGETAPNTTTDRALSKAMAAPPGRPLWDRPGAIVVLLGGTTLRFGWAWELPAYILLCAALPGIALVDLRHHRIPNRVVAPLAGGALALLGLAAIGDRNLAPFGRATLAGLIAGTALLALALLSGGGMGMGDVKLGFVLGLYLGWLGWADLVVGLFLAFFLAAMTSVALLRCGRTNHQGLIPFGPFLALGALIAILWE